MYVQRVDAMWRTRPAEPIPDLEGLIARYGAEVKGIARLILRNEADAEDVLAETFIRAWRRRDQLREEGALRAWLLTIATRQSLSWRRRAGAALRLRDLGMSSSVGGPEERIPALDLLAALDRLPVRMRAVLILRYYGDLPVKVIAHAVSRSPNTVKTELRIGLERLRQDLNRSQEGATYRADR